MTDKKKNSFGLATPGLTWNASMLGTHSAILTVRSHAPNPSTGLLHPSKQGSSLHSHLDNGFIALHRRINDLIIISYRQRLQKHRRICDRVQHVRCNYHSTKLTEIMIIINHLFSLFKLYTFPIVLVTHFTNISTQGLNV